MQKKNDFDGANIYESIDETIKNHLITKSKIAINISGVRFKYYSSPLT